LTHLFFIVIDELIFVIGHGAVVVVVVGVLTLERKERDDGTEGEGMDVKKRCRLLSSYR
jgi:hypothetical protein